MCISFGNPSEPCCGGGARSQGVVKIDISRCTELVGPVETAPELPTFTDAWAAHLLPGSYAINVQTSSTPVRTDPDGTKYWEVRCQPMRHRIGAGELQYGFTEAALRMRAAESSISQLTGHSGTIPNGAHCGPMILKTVDLPSLCGRNGSPHHLDFLDDGSEIVAVRLLVNGRDVSGVVLVSVPMTLARPGLGYGLIDRFAPPARIELAEPITVSSTAVIQWDVWTILRVKGTTPAALPTLYGYAAPITVPSADSGDNLGVQFPLFSAVQAADANFRRLYRKGVFSVDVPANAENIFDGFTGRLRFEARDGWTYSHNGTYDVDGNAIIPPTVLQMSHVATGQSITIDFARELPQVVLSAGQLLRYQVFGTSYDPWEYGRHGVWNPFRKTNFQLQGILLATAGYLPGSYPWVSLGRHGGILTGGFPPSLRVRLQIK